ncbi:MAG: molybdopterin-dependent oxidoreductase [Melioribacteraceae bacterium]|nr:molybdopterin-dependent oxidoreductase [Melioribacteraceae bacterium]
MKSSDVIKHVKGESIFVDDMPVPQGTLYASVFDSKIAHGKITKLDLSETLKVPGVVKVITYKDIPGENQIGNIIPDEHLLAEGTVQFIGEPIAIVIAETEMIAKKAKSKIKIEYEELTPITDPREAYEKGSLIIPPRIFSMGDVENSFNDCEYIIEDRIEISGQEHLYLETQGAVAVPSEGRGIKIYSSTQGPTAVQSTAAKVLNLKMHQVEVDVLRLGGAFGGKEDQATPWAVMAALGAKLTNKPVKLILHRHDDLRMTGKRHPYSADYKIGLSKDYKILAYEVTFYQNAGAAADLSPAVLERTLFHTTNSYFIPNVKATAISCKTNLPPNTAFRGFGGPQGMFVIESAIHKAANKIGIEPYIIQKKNLLAEGNKFYYGQIAERVNASRCWNKAETKYSFDTIKSSVEEFNKHNTLKKKGVSFMPVCFGISFTNTMMNQASALVHIYTDGSVSVSTAAVEMGQGVNEKMINIASKVFSIDKAKVKVESTNTTRVANTSPTAASSAADLNGNALLFACISLLARLKKHAAYLLKLDDENNIKIVDGKILHNGKETELDWNKLIRSVNQHRISLTAQAFYATPDIYFDKKKEQGHPFAYHVYGTAITEVTVDCLRGTYEIDSVKVVHDYGKTLNHAIDLGQVEGGIVQGIGWMTVEELVQDNKGRLNSNSLSTYKIPDIYSAPKKIETYFLEESENPYGPFKSKAVGEPPLMYGIGAFFAISNAVKAFNPNVELKYSSPITHEKTLMQLYQGRKTEKERSKITSSEIG